MHLPSFEDVTPGRSDMAFTSPPTLKKSPARQNNGVDGVIIRKISQIVRSSRISF